MTKLSRYPTVVEAASTILELLSAPLMQSRIDDDLPVPEGWEERFAVAEFVLTTVKLHKLADIQHILTWEQLGELAGAGAEPDESCWSHVVEPESQSARWVLEAIRMHPNYIVTVMGILGSFDQDGTFYTMFVTQGPQS